MNWKNYTSFTKVLKSNSKHRPTYRNLYIDENRIYAINDRFIAWDYTDVNGKFFVSEEDFAKAKAKKSFEGFLSEEKPNGYPDGGIKRILSQEDKIVNIKNVTFPSFVKKADDCIYFNRCVYII